MAVAGLLAPSLWDFLGEGAVGSGSGSTGLPPVVEALSSHHTGGTLAWLVIGTMLRQASTASDGLVDLIDKQHQQHI